MIFVSYAFYSKSKSGFGNINMHMDGICSSEEKSNVEAFIKQDCISNCENAEDVEVAILNWRKYDSPL